jgi:hypothetical protein
MPCLSEKLSLVKPIKAAVLLALHVAFGHAILCAKRRRCPKDRGICVTPLSSIFRPFSLCWIILELPRVQEPPLEAAAGGTP